MTKKISNKASMMAPLFPQHDQEEEARLLKESRRSGKAKTASNSESQKKVSSKGRFSKTDTKARGAVTSQSKGLKSSSLTRALTERPKAKKISAARLAAQDQKLLPNHGETKVSADHVPAGTRSCDSFRNEEMIDYCQTTDWDETAAGLGDNDRTSDDRSESCVQDSHRLIPTFDIPEDALPPPRPEPYLTLRPSLQLHSKLVAQAKDEGISVEALALEMLAEGVVLRAWEIIERKGAMRGQTSSYSPAGSAHHYPSRNQWAPPRHGDQNNSRHGSSLPEPNYNSHYYQGASSPREAPGYYGSGGTSSQRAYRPRSNQAWKEDQSAFLEYVRNQEKRGRR